MSPRSFIIIVCLFSNIVGFTQKDLAGARKEMSLYNFSQAVEILQKLVSGNPKQDQCEASRLIAECYRMMNDTPNAAIWYEKTIRMAGRCDNASRATATDYFYYAQALRSGGEYIRAKKIFLCYDSMAPTQQRGALFAAWCDSAVRWKNTEPVFEVTNTTTLNSAQSEFGTVFYRQGIVFASDRISQATIDQKYGWTGNNYLQLFYSEAADRADLLSGFKVPTLLSELPGKAWHDGPATFNNDFTKVFVTQTQLHSDKGKKEPGSIRTHVLKIVSSELKAGKWSDPAPFFLNSDDYSVGHPALSADGNTLYFVSDMPGGFGETDIWYCTDDGLKWSAPVNLGPTINTSGKEMFPVISPGGDLVFASDGFPGFGGLDLFTSNKIGKEFSHPQNMGLPINSSYDDFSLAFAENDSAGLFSSNRPGGMGGDDIYSFKKINPREKQPSDSMTVEVPRIPILDTLQINRNYRLENIFYNFDKWDIREDAQPSLDKLVAIMKEYPVRIELGSHTDCRGSDSYNLQLSQKRAESAVSYIISSGIPANRIVARGYGKTQLINRCNCTTGISCSEAEHQENRRTEFKITSIGK